MGTSQNAKRTAKLFRDAKPVVAEFNATFRQCMLCNSYGPLETHEIANRHARPLARGKRECLLRLCQWCHHEDIHAKRDIAFELAIKYEHDRKFFDKALVLGLLGYAPSFVTMEEIHAYLPVEPRSCNHA